MLVIRRKAGRRFAFLLVSLLVLACSGCAVHDKEKLFQDTTSLHVAVGQPPSAPLELFAPVFILPEAEQSFNRIGKVVAQEVDGYEKISIDPNQPVVYCGRFPFSTQGGTYLNLVYRIHFQKTPFSLVPFHFAAGDNVGLLVVVTLGEDSVPLLVTTVNTCGCYAVVIPTDALPKEAYPLAWREQEQHVYGEILPALLREYEADDALLITVRPQVHRVMDVRVVGREELVGKKMVQSGLLPLDSLRALPLSGGETTSFYYETWPLQGHVKGSIKPWESLLLSLVSLDLYVGMDKEYGDTKQSGNPFYTSLLPWNRQGSDMNNFAQFLHFWGWRL